MTLAATMTIASFVAAPAIAVGYASSTLLADARFIFGAAPNPIQDVAFSILGALTGEIIGGGCGIVLGSCAAKAKDNPSGGLAVGMMMIVGGLGGLALGTTAGAVLSIACSHFGK